MSSDICTRFPPEPSGFMHLGHLLAANINLLFAQKFHGQCIVRFDDTNPIKAKSIYVDAFLKNFELLNLQFAKITYTSDSFPLLLQYARKLIEQGDAYVDTSSQEDIKVQRKERIYSPCRDQSITTNLQLFDDNVAGLNAYVLRAKIDYSSKNGAMRDPIIYRVVQAVHYRKQSSGNFYPTYDFSCPILDSLDGISHTFRTNEYNDRNVLYYWILDRLNLRKPLIRTFASLKFTDIVLSKRSIQSMIDRSDVSSWDDPRLFTIDGLVQRGFHPSAMQDFIAEHLKSVKNCRNPDKYQPCQISVVQDPHKFYLYGNKYVNKVGPRSVAITAFNSYIMNIKSNDDSKIIDIPIHPKDKSMGVRPLLITNSIRIEKDDAKLLTTGMTVTLLNYSPCSNVNIIDINHDDRIVNAEFNPDIEISATKYKLTWLSTDIDTRAVLIDYSGIIEITTKVYIDPWTLSLPLNTHIQLMRKGNFIINDVQRLIKLPGC